MDRDHNEINQGTTAHVTVKDTEQWSKSGKEQKIETLILTHFKIYYETTITDTYNTDIKIDK